MTEEIINQTEQPTAVAPVIVPTREMMEKYFEMTGLKLDPNCHLDSEFVKKWYETKYLTGVHVRFVLPKGTTITHYGDGIIYKNTNITDEIALRLISENPDYGKIFIDLQNK